MDGHKSCKLLSLKLNILITLGISLSYKLLSAIGMRIRNTFGFCRSVLFPLDLIHEILFSESYKIKSKRFVVCLDWKIFWKSILGGCWPQIFMWNMFCGCNVWRHCRQGTPGLASLRAGTNLQAASLTKFPFIVWTEWNSNLSRQLLPLPEKALLLNLAYHLKTSLSP